MEVEDDEIKSPDLFPAAPPQGALCRTRISISGMICASCVRTIETALAGQTGVEKISVNLLMQIGEVDFDPQLISLEQILEAVDDVGFHAEVARGGIPKPILDSFNPQPVTDSSSVMMKAKISVKGMTCSSCVGTVERALLDVPGMENASVNLLLEVASVEYDPERVQISSILEAVEDVGFDGSIAPNGEPTRVENPGSSAIRESNIVKYTFDVEGMTCASCTGTIEKHLQSIPGTKDVAVNLLMKVVTATLDLDVITPAQVEEEVSDIGFEATVRRSGDGGAGDLRQQSEDFLAAQKRTIRGHLTDFLFCAVFTVPVLFLSMLFPYISSTSKLIHEPVAGSRLAWGSLVMGLLTTPVQFGVGARFFRSAWKSLRHKSADMNTLIAIGTGAAYIFALMDTIQRLSETLEEAEEGQEQSHGATMGNTHFFETAAMLITFVCMGRLLESIAKSKTSSAITELMNLQPSGALLVTLKQASKDKPLKAGDVLETVEMIQEKEMDAGMLLVGDIVKVVRGGVIPADGCVLHGQANVDESMLTGEPIPVAKHPKSSVIGGTICQEGTLYVYVEKCGEDSMLASIIRMTTEAQTSKAPIQQFADWVSGIFVPVVVLIAILTFIIWFILGASGALPEDWLLDSDGAEQSAAYFAFVFSITVLVIACPCALGLATPTAVMVGTGVGAKLGVLVKGGLALETASSVEVMVFDKTGTLTRGKPEVVEMELFSCAEELGLGAPEVAFLAGTAERDSEHVLAKAVVNWARDLLASHATGLRKQEGRTHSESPAVSPHASPVLSPGSPDSVPPDLHRLTVSIPALSQTSPEASEQDAAEGFLGQAQAFQAVSGRGLRCEVQGHEILLGNRQWLEDSGYSVDATVEEALHQQENSGRTALLLGVASRVVGVLSLEDTVKPEARRTLRWLRERGIEVWMCTGDNPRTAKVVADRLGIGFVKAEALPGDKQTLVRELKDSGRAVGMIGDGINDSPALAEADLAVSLASGTAIAMEAADVVLHRDNLSDLCTALDLSRATLRRIRWNFLWALGYNSLGIPVAAGLFYPAVQTTLPPELAALAMALSSVCVVLSSLLLRWYKRPEVAQAHPEDLQTSKVAGLFGQDEDNEHLEDTKKSRGFWSILRGWLGRKDSRPRRSSEMELADMDFEAVVVDGSVSSTAVDLVQSGCGCVTKRSNRKQYSALPSTSSHHGDLEDGYESEVAQGPCDCGCSSCGLNEDGLCRCGPGHSC